MEASHLMTACPSWTRLPKREADSVPCPRNWLVRKSYVAWTKSLKSFLYRERTLRVWNCPALKEWSRPLESEREFRLRLVQASREERDQGVEDTASQICTQAGSDSGADPTRPGEARA